MYTATKQLTTPILVWHMAMSLYMNKEKNLSPSQGLNLGLPNTSQMLLITTTPPGLLGIGAENITTSVVILIVHKSILY